MPYPYFIDEEGLVGRQIFWKGSPKKLIGFSEKPTTAYIDLPLGDFLAEAKKAVGMYPIFSDDKGTWFTKMVAIERVTVEEEG